MQVDVLLYFEEYCEIDIDLFEWSGSKNVNIRYIIMSTGDLFEKFEDFYSKYGLNVRILYIGKLLPFHYLSFYELLKSDLRRSVDKYIITKNYNKEEIISLLNSTMDKSSTLLKVNYMNNDITTYVLSQDYFEVFNIRTNMNLYLEDCFRWNVIKEFNITGTCLY